MENPICYLCGKPINTSKEKVSGDHVPPKQFFPKELRDKLSPTLLKLPTHTKCNTSYQPDEDYFVSSLGPLAANSASGMHLFNDLEKKLRKPKTVGLLRKILSEFDPNPSGLYLPNNKVMKYADVNRIYKIAWKIVRGLHFNKSKFYLPIETHALTKLYTRDDSVPEYFNTIFTTEIIGEYPAIFAYRYKYLHGFGDAHFWALYFWDFYIIPVIFSLSSDSPLNTK